MKWKLVVLPDVQKYLQHLSPETKKYVRLGLKEIQLNPKLGKRLKDELDGLFSYRVRRHRIIYKIVERKVTVVVIAIGRRDSIYETLDI